MRQDADVSFMYTMRAHHNGVLNQWMLIQICLERLMKVEGSSLVESLKKVNLNAEHRVPFVEWMLIR